MNNNGYTAGSANNYSFNGVWDALSHGPTYIRGTNSTPGEKYGEGHAWVIHGAKEENWTCYDLYTYNYNGRILEHYHNTQYGTTKSVKYN